MATVFEDRDQALGVEQQLVAEGFVSQQITGQLRTSDVSQSCSQLTMNLRRSLRESIHFGSKNLYFLSGFLILVRLINKNLSEPSKNINKNARYKIYFEKRKNLNETRCSILYYDSILSYMARLYAMIIYLGGEAAEVEAEGGVAQCWDKTHRSQNNLDARVMVCDARARRVGGLLFLSLSQTKNM